jgi:hypothetical protein
MSLPKKDVYSTLSDYGRKVLNKSCSECLPNSKPLRSKNKIRPTPTPPNSPNYEYIQKELTVKTIEEPYSIAEVTNKNDLIDKPKPDRTSFQICKIM